MLETLYGYLRTTHIVLGFVCTAAFWAAALSKKGGRIHVRAGAIYVFSLAVVLVTATCASVAVIYEPHLKYPQATSADRASVVLGQLGLLWGTLLTGVSCWQGLWALRFKGKHAPATFDPHGILVAIHWFCIASVIGLFIANAVMGRYIISAISFIMMFAAIWNLRATKAFGQSKRDWYLEHLRGLLLSGVFVQAIFGMVSLTKHVVAFGIWAIAAVWVLPFVLGMLAIQITRKHFQRKLTGLT